MFLISNYLFENTCKISSDWKNKLVTSVFRLFLICVTGSGNDANESASLPVLAVGGFILAFIPQPFLEELSARNRYVLETEGFLIGRDKDVGEGIVE